VLGALTIFRAPRHGLPLTADPLLLLFARPGFYSFCSAVTLVYRWYENQVASAYSGEQGLS